VRKKRNR